jgi:hypothetical protein
VPTARHLKTASSGKTKTTDLGDITAYTVEFPVTPQDETANDIGTQGMQFAVADIKDCSNGTTSSDGYGYFPSDLQLVDIDDRVYSFWNVQISARIPNLTDALDGTMRARALGQARGG